MNQAERDSRERDIEQKIARVEQLESERFTDLVQAAGLDPSRDFRFARLRSQIFNDCDLSSFDFSGSDLRGAKYTRARLGSAKFNGAAVDLDGLREANDWHVQRRRIVAELRASPAPKSALIDGHFTATFVWHRGDVLGAIELNDGHALTWSSEGYFNVWSPSGRLIAEVKGAGKPILGARQLVGGTIVTWSRDGVSAWAPSTFACLYKSTTAASTATELPDGSLLCLHPNGWPFIWWLGHPRVSKLEYRAARALVVLDAQHTAILCGLNQILVFDAQGPRYVLLNHIERVRGVCGLRGERMLTWSEDRTLQICSLKGERLAVLASEPEGPHGAIELDTGRIVSWERGGYIRVWSPNGQHIADCSTGERYRRAISGLAALSEKSFLAWCPTSVWAWSSSGELLFSRDLDPGSEIVGVSALADGGVAASLADGAILIWTRESPSPLRLEGHGATARGVRRLRGGGLLTWAKDGSVGFWRAAH